MRTIALVARYHSGALPRVEKRSFAAIPQEQRLGIMALAGILRLADCFDPSHDRRIGRLEVQRVGEALVIAADSYSETGSLAEKLAGARYLLEVALRVPVLIRSRGRSAASYLRAFSACSRTD